MISQLIQKLKNYQKPVLGIGVTAFTRLGPAFFLPNYQIICLLETADLLAIRKTVLVFSLEKDFKINPYSLIKQNTSTIMSLPQVKAFLKAKNKASLLVYKSSVKIEAICSQLGYKILNNPVAVAAPFEDKKKFRSLGAKAGLRLIPGKTMLIKDLSLEKFFQYQKKWGDLVFQLPDYKVGGGIGTFFIKNKADWQEFKAYVKRRRLDGKNLRWVNITKLIKGINASISACVTKHGVLAGLLQTQLIDIKETRAFKGRSGVWCGHEWGKKFSFKAQKQAVSLAQKIGRFMAKKGYKGMFGLDLIIDQNNEVWPVECNARYTGGFPVYSMMQALYNEPAFDIFHLAEFLGLDYQLNLSQLNQLYQQPKTAAHLVLHNQTRKWVKVEGSLKAGVYQLKKQKLVWQRPGFSLADLKKDKEFVLADRAAIKGRILKPGERLARILFKRSISLSSTRLNAWAAQVCLLVYKAYNLKIIPSQT